MSETKKYQKYKRKYEKIMDARFIITHVVFREYVSSNDWYYQNVPEETQDRISKSFEQFIKSIIDIDDMETLSVGQICSEYIFPLTEHVIKVEEDKLRESNKSEEIPDD